MNKSKILLSLFVLITVSTVGFTVYRFIAAKNADAPADSQHTNTPAPKPTVFTAINGAQVTEDLAKKRPLAVIIENYPDSRPQSGLHKADIVYETLAEGGITRFLAIFQTSDAEKIGPVRSARPYFAEFANHYHALFAHVGGSDEVLADLEKNKYPQLTDANEYYFEKYFLRDKKKPAPHNVFTSSQKLYELLNKTNTNSPTELSLWKYGDIPVGWQTNQANTITADFSLKDYFVKFEYDSATKSYSRTQSNKPHMDAETKTRIAPKNVVVLTTTITEIPNDPKLRVTIDTQNGGKAVVFRNGQAIQGLWKKTSASGIQFMTQDNQEIPLATGQTWVMLLSNDTERLKWETSNPTTNERTGN